MLSQTARATTTLAALAFLASPALAAPTVFLGTQQGEIHRLTDTGTELAYSLPSFGAVTDIAAIGDTMFVTDTSGNVTRIDIDTGSSTVIWNWHGIGVTAVTPADGDLVISLDTWEMYKIDATTGAVDTTYYADMAVSGLVADRGELFVGGPNTFIFKTPIGENVFTFLSACGGIVTSLDFNGNELLAGDLNGTVYRFDRDNGLYLGTFATGTDTVDIAMAGADLVVIGSDGTLERRDPVSGALVASESTGLDLTAVLGVDTSCPADFDADGTANADDIDLFVSAFIAGNADLDGDGDTDTDDINAFVDSFVAGC